MQAELLAVSGLERAAAQLAASGDYVGETWNLGAAALAARRAAAWKSASHPTRTRQITPRRRRGRLSGRGIIAGTSQPGNHDRSQRKAGEAP